MSPAGAGVIPAHAAERVFSTQFENLDALAKEQFLEVHNRAMYEIQKGTNVGFDVGVDERKLERIINKPWTTDKMTFSDRIWRDKQRLAAKLENTLTQGVALGRDVNEMIDDIAATFETTWNNAARIIATESSYISALAEEELYKELGVEFYEIIATLDMSTSDICQDMDGEVFPVSEFEPCVTANPFHPWCRTTTGPHFPDDFGERIARDPKTGQTYYVPSDMKYKEWKEVFVDKTEKHGKFELLEIKANDGQELMDSLQKFENALDKLPDKHRDEMMNFIERIEFGSENNLYDTETKTIYLQPNASVSDIIHEIGHAMHQKHDLWNNTEFKQIVQRGLPAELRFMDMKNISARPGEEVLVWQGRGCEKFVHPYQGRVYPELVNGFTFRVTDLHEYFSVGLETYISTPPELKTRDPLLFDFIERFLNE